jgi:type I restriction enzyme M protein
MPPKKNSKTKNGNGATLGIENELWEAADKLRGHLDAAEYKSVVLGLIFLKYISDMFEQVRARWKNLQDNAKQESVGNLIDSAMEAIERDNPTLKGMLPGKSSLRPVPKL